MSFKWLCKCVWIPVAFSCGYVQAYDLEVGVELSSQELVSGDAFDVRLQVTNHGAEAAPGVVVTNEIPFQAQFAPLVHPGVSVSGRNLRWQIGDMAGGVSTSLVLNAQLLDSAVPGEWMNVAYAKCGSGSASTRVRGHARAHLTGRNNIDLTVSNNVDIVEPGDEVTWWFTVTNRGPHTVFGASLEGLFPPGLKDISWGCRGRDPRAVLEPLMTNEADGRVSAGDGPGQLTWTPDGRFVYVVNFYGDNISRFARDPITGMLYPRPSDSPGGAYAAGDGARILVVSPDGNHLYCANALAGDVYHYRIDRVDGNLSLVPGSIPGETGYPSGNNTRSIGIHPNGKFLYACNFADNNLSAFAIDPDHGTLSFLPSSQAGGKYASGTGPHAMVFNTAGTHLYVQHREGGDVAHFVVDTTTGGLTKIPSAESDGNYTSGSFTADIAISPDNRFLYTCNAYADTCTVYSLNASTGKPSYIGSYPTGDWPVSIIMAMEGNYVLIVNNVDEDVRVYRRNAVTGALTLMRASVANAGYDVGTYPGANGGLTPDGRHIYVCNFGSDDISLFSVRGSTVCPHSGRGSAVGSIDVAVGGSVTFCVTGRVDVAATEDVLSGLELDFRGGRFSLLFPNRSPTGTVADVESIHLRDDDSDGKPDRWEEFNGLDAGKHDPELDSDRDGQTDYAEFVANTDPSDATSGVRIRDITVGEDKHEAKFEGSPLRQYILEYRDDPNSEWLPVTPQERGEGLDSSLENHHSILMNQPRCQYRLRVIVP